jgi:glycosyltransferase involved in cell wall biosynthesis
MFEFDKKPLVSIGIPVYNGEKYLSFAIKSTLRQTYENFELILLNDGSTDNSLEIMKYFARNDNRIIIIDDGRNIGLIERLNQLVTLANGNYFTRMDADDIMFPDRIEKQLYKFLNDKSIDLVHSAAISIDTLNKILGIKKISDPQKNPTKIIHPTVMGKKKFFEKNPYKQGYYQMEDYELWYRTYKKHKFEYMNEPLLFYRENSDKISNKHKKMIEGKKKFVEDYSFSFYKRNTFILNSKFKFFIYKLFEYFKVENFLMSKRFKVLDKESKLKYSDILKNIIG